MKIERKRLLEWNSKKTFELAENEIVLTFSSIKGGSTLKIPYSDISSNIIDYKIAYAPYSSLGLLLMVIAAVTSFLDMENVITYALFGLSFVFWLLYIFAKREYKGFMNKNHKTQSLFFIEMDSSKETADFITTFSSKLSD
jgi:hypothetical protein